MWTPRLTRKSIFQCTPQRQPRTPVTVIPSLPKGSVILSLSKGACVTLSLSKGDAMWIRLAACLAAAAVLCACAGPKSPSAQSTPTARPAAPAAASGPANALVSQVGKPGAVPLNAAQRQELDAALAKLPRALRARLRYGVASGDDGKQRLVVYDGEGLGAEGRHPGRKHEYIVFRVLNSTRGEHYDPQQNTMVAPIPPPVQREGPISP